MSRLSLSNILAQVNQENIAEKAEEELKNTISNFKYISIHDLVPSEGNFYSMEQIQELKTTIELAGRVLQNLNVFPLGNGKYRVVAGHRRCMASWQLVEEGKKEFEMLPCCVEETEEDAKAQALREELLLILTNSQREKTDYDKIQEVERLTAVLKEYKKRENIPGRMRELIAKILDTSTTQVQRRDSVSKNLSNEFKQELKEQNINMSTAIELAKLPPEEQQTAYQAYTDKGSISADEVKSKKTKQKSQSNPTPNPSTTVITKTTITEEVTQKEPEQLTPDRLLNVYVCSAYSGEDEDYLKAVRYCKHVVAQGHIPFSSAVMLHGILDGGHYERMLNMLQVGFEMIRIVDEVWVFEEDGEITQDMLHQKELAKQLGKKILQLGGICEDG
ncbi:ParB/RepB/Spo0J family partition protein [Ruminiclostridium josui]|uniref:ParB/RepB/Spo0J family partition protein n=1 Tax=Ruminiclostridium josui TaxID=1499 RepID=UPI00046308BB|nr:ParB/RepB/Spo0J family partition protein [Ruminiclostridium josui]